MSDLVAITTNLRDPGGTGRTGTLYATLPNERILLAGGGYALGGRIGFTVVDGVAADLELYVTEDSNPTSAYSLAFLDANGKLEELGVLQVPRVPGGGPIDLDDYLTLEEG